MMNNEKKTQFIDKRTTQKQRIWLMGSLRRAKMIAVRALENGVAL